MDSIYIDKLEVFARHGVMREENALGQKFIISAKLELDAEEAGLDDDIEKTVSYAEVCERIKEFNKNNTLKLIEAVAAGTAEMILKNFERVRAVTLRVDKPNPPIHMHFDSVAAELVRRRHTVYISVGSNMGNREEYIKNAVRAIDENEHCRVKRVSKMYETKPYGGVEQGDFLNAVIEAETIFSAKRFLDLLHEIENANGRVRTVHWGPRTLDLDIIFFDDEVINTPELTVPHRDMQNRRFVLEPLNELAPYAMHPLLKKDVGRLFDELECTE